MSIASQYVKLSSSSDTPGLALAVIQIDGGTQSRATLNEQVVNDYAEAIQAGATFPPIVVFYDGKKHWLADGFHRFHAYQKAGREKVAADVRQGTRRDAILHSVGANETHGLRRTNDDKRRAVLTLLNDSVWGKWTDREIARACHVDNKTVAKVRSEVTEEIPSERTYVTKHGTTATMKTAGINASRVNTPRPSKSDEPYPEAGPQAEASSAGREVGLPADREGRLDGEAASVDLPTISGDTDAIQRAWMHGYLIGFMSSGEGWNGEYPFQDGNKSPEDNQQFVDARAAAFTAARSNLGQEAYSNAGGGDVDRATRASSAVEVGATNSPDGATKLGSHAETHNSHHVGRVSDAQRQGAVAAQAPETKLQSATNPAEAVAETPMVPRPTVTAAPFQALSKADQIKLVRPHCQHPGSDQCGGSGRNHCHACKKLMENEAA